jgi:hypothetical protein
MRREGQQKLRIVPLNLAQANQFVSEHHRHHKPMPGCKFSIGVVDETGILHGVAICGRPVSREIQAQEPLTLEVNRTATDGFPNANSALYGACWRIAIQMGYTKVITDNQEGESGRSLLAAGFVRGITRRPRKNWHASSIQRKEGRDASAWANVLRTRWSRA